MTLDLAKYPELEALALEMQRSLRGKKVVPATYPIHPDRWADVAKEYRAAEDAGETVFLARDIPEMNFLLLGIPVTIGV